MMKKKYMNKIHVRRMNMYYLGENDVNFILSQCAK